VPASLHAFRKNGVYEPVFEFANPRNDVDVFENAQVSWNDCIAISVDICIADTVDCSLLSCLEMIVN
jgi:hypothetical protein